MKNLAEAPPTFGFFLTLLQAEERHQEEEVREHLTLARELWDAFGWKNSHAWLGEMGLKSRKATTEGARFAYTLATTLHQEYFGEGGK